MASETDDQISLFGSPSPSRSPSPVLALPTKRGGEGVSAGSFVATNIAQNVGTIALPGSHHYSELPNVSLALPLSCLQAPQPFVHAPHIGISATAVPSPITRPQPPSTSLTRSRALSTLSSSTTSSGKKKKKRKRTEVHPSPAPSIALPDPSVTPPPNFLRNQMALLGTAGLVAGLKPAKMQLNTPRGATPTNPIVLDDGGDSPRSGPSSKMNGVVYVENDAPKLGKRFGSLTPSSDIDQSLLPAPTNEEIVAMLMAHKDIYPILRNILRLIAGQRATAVAEIAQQSKSVRPSSTPTTTGPRAPPLKRRRLNRVPAGAVDWDVPYPFQEGEGPTQYRKAWEKERGKRLVSQLLDLVRIAARKAAIRKYRQQQEALHRALRAHSAPASLHDVIIQRNDHALDSAHTPLLESSQHIPQLQGQPTSGAEPSTLIQSLPDSVPQLFMPLEPAQGTPLDQLISSLLAATTPGFNFTDLPTVAPDNAHLGEDSNESLIDSWMNIFQMFPAHSDGSAPNFDAFTSSAASTLALGSTDFPFFDMTPAFNFNSYMHTQSTQINDFENTIQNMLAATQMSSVFPPFQNTSLGLDSIPTPSNAMTCDASSISQPQPKSLELVDLNRINTCIQNDPGAETFRTPTSVSPMHSTCSVRSSSVDPSTPASASWESAAPDIAFVLSESHLQEHTSSQGEGEVIRFTARGKKWPEESSDIYMDLGHGREVQSCIAAAAPAQSSNTPSTIVPQSVSPGSRQSKLSKEDIIRLAQERRQKLLEELERVKTRLWETTIEQGVLIELQKQLLP